MMNYGLVDTWRIRNPNSEEFFLAPKSPIIQRRLDYWLITGLLQDDVGKVDIVTAIKIGTQWVLVSAAIGIVLKIVVFLLTADEEITEKALSSLVFFLALGMTLVC